ncbi:MAG: DUF1549 domain-containing protein [Gemmataceae bacterium]
MLIRLWLVTGCLFVFGSSASWAEEVLAAEQRWAKDGPGGVPGFTRHVQPLLGKLGCSNRACHGSFQGQGGFRLSLFSSDPQMDHDGLVKEQRLDPRDPDESLALLKATNIRFHKGGERFSVDSWPYRLLRDWIAAGAPYRAGQEASVERLEITPAQVLLSAKGSQVRLRVVAHFADRTTEDVTALTQFTSNDDSTAAIDESGRITALRPGDTVMVATFGGGVRTVPVLVPLPGAKEREFAFPAQNRIDELVAGKLRQLGVVPAPLCDDAEFLRRVSIDITGTLPTPDEVLAFLSDKDPNKRNKKIDELLERPAYAVWWTTKLCDQTGLNALAFLGGTEFASLVGQQWQRWIEKRVQDNVGYDRLVEGIVLASSRQPGQSYEDYTWEMSSYCRTQAPEDYGNRAFMPHYWHRSNVSQPEEKALHFAYAFLGVRLDCAQCHKHPFDVWTQQDFQQFTMFFERIKTGIAPDAEAAHQRLQESLGMPIKEIAAKRRGKYLQLARAGEPAPWREVYIAAPAPPRKEKPALKAKLLGGAEVDTDQLADPRQPLMAWLRQPDNPYFAPAFVNRVWAYYFGKGIVNPPDDHHLGNPPSNPELLAYLSQGFIKSGYDMKWLHREITSSRTYQLSWQTNDSNRSDERNFSHALMRRLPAEVAVDAIYQATADQKQLAQVHTNVTNRRIGVQATASFRSLEFALAVFGKPLRQVNCDCERESDPSLAQAIFLRNDQDLLAALDRKDGWLQEVKPDAEPAALARAAYLRTLSRLPDDQELRRSVQHLTKAQDLKEGLRDLLWALLNTQEFITNH